MINRKTNTKSFDRKNVLPSGLAFFYCNDRHCTSRLSARYSSKINRNIEIPVIEKLPGPHLLRNGIIHPPAGGKRFKELATFKIKEKIDSDPLKPLQQIYEEVVFHDVLTGLGDPTDRMDFLHAMPVANNC